MKNNNKRDEHSGVVCTVCLHNVWDCTCAHDTLQTEQFIEVGPTTKAALDSMRQEEEKKKK
jgi:hypothetical protein